MRRPRPLAGVAARAVHRRWPVARSICPALVVFVASAIFLRSPPAQAHEFRALAASIVEVQDTGKAATYRATVHNPNSQPIFRDPARTLANIGLALPPTCQPQGPRAHPGPQTWSQTFVCSEPLTGPVGLTGLDLSLVDAVLQLQLPAAPKSVVLTAASPTVALGAGDELRLSAMSYVRIGVEHIFAGLDHLAFVLGLVWLLLADATARSIGGRRFVRRLVAAVTAFTLGHSLSLVAVTALGVHPAAPPIETLIALSVVILARELCRPSGAEPTLSTSQPWLVACGFGLLHGCGFAGALAEIGLPSDGFLLALAAFNLGVEAGQLCVVAALLALLWPISKAWGRGQNWQRLKVTGGYVLGIVAATWTLDRALACFFPS